MSNLLEGYLAESGLVPDVLIVDAVDARGLLGDMYRRVDPAGLDLGAAVRHDLDHGYLYDTVCGDIEAGALDVEEDYGVLEIEFHFT